MKVDWSRLVGWKQVEVDRLAWKQTGANQLARRQTGAGWLDGSKLERLSWCGNRLKKVD